MATERSFSIYQIAQLLGATPAVVTEWINKGQLPCKRFPNGPERVSEQALIQFLKQQGIDIREIVAKVALRQDLDDQALAEQELPPPATLEKSSNISEDSSSQVAQAIIQDAVERHASHIHLENHSDGLALRLRIDGSLREKINFKSRLPQNLGPKLIPHFKSLAGLDGQTYDRPQTGRFALTVGGREINFRLTSCPTIHGEKLLIRILDRQSELLDLSQLGFEADDQIQIKHILSRMSGLLVVAAPPRNGRTTTLRAMLAQLDCQDRNILTIEKSPDYEFDAVNQSRVNPLSGFTFAQAAATFASLDPDAVMIEVIRDPPTAHAVLEMAISGSLVLAGINASSAADAIAALLDMGLEPYALSSTLKAVIAQRTLRKICPNCKQKVEPASELLDKLGLQSQQNDSRFYGGQGCSSCSNSGYSGRVGIFETLWLDAHLAKLLRNGADIVAVQQAAQQARMQTLRQLACDRATSGLTSLEEIARVLLA